MVGSHLRNPMRRLARHVVFRCWTALAILLLAGSASADSNWNTLIWDSDVWAMPEPRSAWMLVSGAAAVAWLHLRRRHGSVRSG